MASKNVMRTLAVIAFAKGLADRTTPQTNSIRRLSDACERAIWLWPDEVTDRDVLRLDAKLAEWEGQTWGGEERHMQTYTSFCIDLVVTQQRFLKGAKNRAFGEIIDALAAIYEEAAPKQEYTACAVAGSRAADVLMEVLA